jgi:2-polyprenyl-6-hydroxyphenyl methylase/3-demethylubiquinone-9 3-methyltransferase
MQVTRRAAIRALRQTFANQPSTVRAHVLGRYHSCPYLRTLHHVAPRAHVLDVGAGHGLFAVLALEAGATAVTALEPDLRKTLSSFRHPRIRFVAGLVDAVEGSFDLVSLFDVLYRVPLADRDRLLGALRERLRPGGRLLIKELDPERRLKSGWNRAQEWVSDRFLGITLGHGLHYETTARLLERLTTNGFERCVVEDIGSGYPHAHVAYTASVRPA